MALKRPALGQSASIGSFYDALDDAFLPISLFRKPVPAASMSTTALQQTTVTSIFDDSYKAKFDALAIYPELGASVLAGLCKPDGCGRYLSDFRDSNLVLQATVFYTVHEAHEKVQFSPELKDCLADPSTFLDNISHVVAEIDWGMQSIVVLRYRLDPEEDRTAAARQLRAEVDELVKTLKGQIKNDPAPKSPLPLDITVFSDVLKRGGVSMRSTVEVRNFVDILSDFASRLNDGKGTPLAYRLIPTSMLEFMGVNIGLRHGLPLPTPNECHDETARLYDAADVSLRTLGDYLGMIDGRPRYVSDDHLAETKDALVSIEETQKVLPSFYLKHLLKLRRGLINHSDLHDLITHYANSDDASSKVASPFEQKLDKIIFIKSAVAKGAKYIGHDTPDLATFMNQRQADDAHVLFFSEASLASDQWAAQKDLLFDILSQAPAGHLVIIVDCDAMGTACPTPRISQWDNGQEVVGDLVAERAFLADKCLARYQPEDLQVENTQRPLKRKFVKIACPRRKCPQDKPCDWICSACMAPLEYGEVDTFIYCDCGRNPYLNFEFRCNALHHGPSYVSFDPDELRYLLKNLQSSDNLNILILGETGVGKSTFINAFVNYLHFNTLDEAIKADKLNTVMPCHFQLQLMDRQSASGAIEEIQIAVGGIYDDERDGSSGESATQKTEVYPITIGTRTIRLIDTPGIGDTRGLSYDKKNMADILATLSSYDDLHGILILLKSNSSRLTVMFDFCIQELLTHLHRSAVDNICFGFTNTRISNYAPGDTYGPLKAILNRHRDIAFNLTAHSTYCFDSESVRYLAARKQGHQMPNLEDFRRSWEHSRMETNRLLDHVSKARPHPVTSTVSLNGTRRMIQELTKPMAEISKTILVNIALSEDKIKELTDTKLSGNLLRKKLKVKQVHLRVVPLKKPRTVCSDPGCCDFKDDGSGSKVQTIYKTHCHALCSLKNVTADQIAHPNLIKCWAFSGQQNCRVCGHSWQLHLHVLYKLEEYNKTVTDKEVKRQIANNASDQALKQAGVATLQRLIDEYKAEQEQIKQAAARFGLFLKHNAITPYNDTTLDYLNTLLRREKDKIDAAHARNVPCEVNERLYTALLEDQRGHIELVDALTRSMNDATQQSPLLDQEGVAQMILDLYELKHFGQMLCAVKTSITAAHETTYRERPFRVQSGPLGHRKIFGNWFQWLPPYLQ